MGGWGRVFLVGLGCVELGRCGPPEQDVTRPGTVPVCAVYAYRVRRDERGAMWFFSVFNGRVRQQRSMAAS